MGSGTYRDTSRDDTPNIERRATTFVGRFSELTWLEQRASAARAGSPQLVLVSGEAGVGKTRLVREAAQRIDGARVVVGRCREAMQVAYAPFRQSLFPLLDGHIRRHPEHESHASLIDELIESLGLASGDAQHVEARTHQLLAAVAALTIEVASDQFLVLMIDDLHWADGSTLLLLESLVAQLSDRSLSGAIPVLVLATMRRAGPGQPAAIERLRREPVTSEVELGGLSPLDIAALVQAFGDRGVSDRELTELADATDGNPLFLEAVLRRQGKGERRQGVHERLPSHISDALAAPLRELDTAARSVLEVVAHLDDVVPSELVAEVLDDDPEAVQTHLVTALQFGIVDRYRDGWVFAHPLYRRVVFDAVDDDRRQQIHAGLAAVLPRRLAHSDPRVLAHHLERAGDLVEARVVVEAAATAGDLEFGACNWARATDHWRVVEQRCRDDDTLATALSIDLADLHHRAGQASVFQGDTEAGRRHYEQAERLYQQEADAAHRLAVQVSRAQAEVAGGSVGLAVDDHEIADTVALVRDDQPAVAADALATMSQVRWASGRLDEAVEVAREAVAVAVEAENPDAEVLARLTLAQVGWTRFEVRQSREQLELAASPARSATLPARRLGAANRLPLNLVWVGELGEAASVAEHTIAADDSLRYRRELGLPLTGLALVEALRGNVRRAEHLLERVRTLDRVTSYSWPSVFARPLHGVVCDLLGRPDEAARSVDQLVDAMGTGSTWGQATRLLHQAEEIRAGRGSVEGSGVEALRPGLRPSIGSAALAAAHVEIAAVSDRPALAAGAADHLATVAARGLVYIGSVAILVDRAWGNALVVEGDFDGGIARLEAGLARASADGAGLEVARTSLDLAEALDRRDTSDDRAQAFELRSQHKQLLGALELRPEPAAESVPAPAPAGDGSYRTQVVVFADVCDSTRLAEAFGDVEYAHKLRERLALVRARATGHGGRVVGHTGDGALLTFDSAAAAIDCAVACHVDTGSSPLVMHIGIHAGDVVELEGNVFGAAVNTAARLCDQASAGETVVSEVIKNLAAGSQHHTYADRGTPTLKGVSRSIRLFSVGAAP